MASREKRPLAPSKSKQKGNNDTSLSAVDGKGKKGKSLPSSRQQQLARDILEAVATGSQLPPKINASLPRKKALKNLKRKQKLRAAKANLIKVKITKKVAIKSLNKIAPNVKKSAKARKLRKSDEIDAKITENDTKSAESDIGDIEGSKGVGASAKNNIRTKKSKPPLKPAEEPESSETRIKEVDVATGANVKTSPKSGKKVKLLSKKATNIGAETTEDNKASKVVSTKRNTSKERDTCTRIVEGESTSPKSKKNVDSVKGDSVADPKSSKLLSESKNSIDLTIDEVIASMLSDSELDDQRKVAEKVEAKITRSRKVPSGEKLIPDGEIKKEIDCDEGRSGSDDDCADSDSGAQQRKITQIKQRSNFLISHRSLRNGKLRQLSDSGISLDLDAKKRRGLSSDDAVISEICAEHASDDNMDGESGLYESNAAETQGNVPSGKNSLSSGKADVQRNFEETVDNGVVEVENNNNSERSGIEIGPTLRSKTKAKTVDGEVKSDDAKTEDVNSMSKSFESQEESKKSVSLEQSRKDSTLVKLVDKPKSRRSSLNIDTKKTTVGSFYGADKADGNPKSQIDQMIENIKLTIAKSIEDKIFGPEKSLTTLNKNFEVSKIEEIVAPLSAESQKLGLEENAEEDKPNVSKSEKKSDKAENSVPRVADTAKEIEKLVMGDMELIDTQSQKTQDEKCSNTDAAGNIEDAGTTSDNRDRLSKLERTCEKESNQESTAVATAAFERAEGKADDAIGDATERSFDGAKRVIGTRKSPRISDRSSSENSVDTDGTRKSTKTTDKGVQKFADAKDASWNEEGDCAAINDGCLDRETFKSDTKAEETCERDSKSTQECHDSADPSLPSTDRSVSGDSKLSGVLRENEAPNYSSSVNEPEKQLNVLIQSEDSETLESISRDVEELVSGGQPNSQQRNDSKSSKMISDDDINGKLGKDPTICDGSVEPEDDKTEESRSLEALDISFTDSEIMSVAAEVGNALTMGDDLQENSVDSKMASIIENLGESTENTKNRSNKYNQSTENDGCDGNIRDSANSTIEEESRGATKDTAVTENTVGKDLNRTEDANSCSRSMKLEDTSSDKESTKKDRDTAEEQNSITEEGRRVLRARDKQRKGEIGSKSRSTERIDSKRKVEDDSTQTMDIDDNQGSSDSEGATPESSADGGNVEKDQNAVKVEESSISETQIRTRRSREAKRRKEDRQQTQNLFKSKRGKRDARKSDQQNKEETLLDNEVAKINENNRSLESKYGQSLDGAENLRGLSEGGQREPIKTQNNVRDLRSKSENDLESVKDELDSEELAQARQENETPERVDNSEMNSDGECKKTKTPEMLRKDSDDASTSEESTISAPPTPKIFETPEDKAKKESILRLLGLESLEKAAERINHQKAKKEQYTGTLKTVIRVQKEKEKDKKRSRSPLRMVLKQGRGDGDGDSPEFYTIQKEFGSSGLGDSSSGANRKFSTNHRHSCDEDNDEAQSKDRQSLVIPEKSSSFSIHPGRLCADVCCYCFGKFGSLDTPMHLAQMKSDERRKKILNVERHLTKDSCLCDACYRHVDRKANTSPTNMQAKPPRQHRQLMVTKCSARDCRESARHHVKRRWLLKIKAGLQNQVDIDWESSQHTSMSFCVNHYSKIERFLTCALCKRRLARNQTHQLVTAETEELNQRLRQQEIPVLLVAGTFVCKLCRYFTQLQLKYKDIEDMNMTRRPFFKNYRKRILHYHDIEVLENEEEEPLQNQSSKDKDKRKKTKCVQNKNGGSATSKSPDGTTNSNSEKSTPEPNKNEGTNSETDNENRSTKVDAIEDVLVTDVRILGIDSAVENLKKRKALEGYATNTSLSCEDASDVVEILAMDKEVTLTRLPKRARTNSDINPVVQRLGANPSISVRTLFPGEEEMNLHASVEFNNVREVTPQGWEKCATMIQYDRDTKLLWQELQRPYGNQSSFLRHLILLEKYYRSGDLVLAPNASRNAINYSTSVQNRLISYEGPEKMDEPIVEPISSEYNSARALSGGYVLERDRLSLPSTSSSLLSSASGTASLSKGSPPRILKLNPGVSIIRKPPPNLQRLNLPSTSATNGSAKRKDSNRIPITSGGKVFQLSEPDFKRLQNLKRQKQMLGDKQQSGGSSSSTSPSGLKPATQYQKAQIAAQTQFQKHLRMQQEMLNRQSRGDFEPLICDVRSLTSETTLTQSLLNNLNLPKSIQVTTKPPSANPIPILPKIPKSLTVIPQTVTRPVEK